MTQTSKDQDMEWESQIMCEELKPCPFCGNTDVGFGSDRNYIYCPNCGIKTQVFENKQKARNAWNERVYETLIENLREEVNFLREKLLNSDNSKFNPEYYKSRDKSLEAIDYIEAHALNFNLGNVVKYVTRAGKKPGEDALTALEKAKRYLDHEIASRRTEATQKLP